MATVKQITDFLAGLPEDTQVVLVCQRFGRPQILRTETLDVLGGYPSWPRAVWDGVSESLQTPPGFTEGSEYDRPLN